MISPSIDAELVTEAVVPPGDTVPERIVVATTRFGEIVVDPATTFTLPDGIPGFADLTALVILPVDDDAMFVWLQALSDGELAFLAVNPWPFFPDYAIEIADEHLRTLGITDMGDVLVFCLARPDRDRRAFHVNLMAPIVFGLGSRRARQVTLDEPHPVDAVLALPDGAAPSGARIRSAGAALPEAATVAPDAPAEDAR